MEQQSYCLPANRIILHETTMRIYILKKYKPLILLIAICALATVYWIVYGPYGASKYAQVTSDLDKVSADIELLTEQNNAMNAEISKLKSDQRYVEDIARKEYGLLKKNEIVFEFKK